MSAQGTGDDTVYCNLCGKETSVAMIGIHLAEVHGYDADEIADAPIFDLTDKEEER
jgi:hypothetical protein